MSDIKQPFTIDQYEAYVRQDLRAETEQLSALSPEALEDEVLAFLGRLSATNPRAKALHLVLADNRDRCRPLYEITDDRARGLDVLCVNGVYYYR